MKNIIFFVFAISKLVAQPAAYSTQNAHSHNDYEQKRPFFEAFERNFGSIEADVYLVDGELYVAHDRKNITKERTFKQLYLLPLLEKLKSSKPNIYPRNGQLQLLIDLKTGGETLTVLESQIKPYRQYFDKPQNKNAIRIVISGNMPKPSEFVQFDTIFTFDGRKNIKYTSEESKRVVLVSESFGTIGGWTLDGTLKPEVFSKASLFVDSLHKAGKKVRLWGTPNKVTTFETLSKLKVDYIGTDSLQLLHNYLTNHR